MKIKLFYPFLIPTLWTLTANAELVFEGIVEDKVCVERQGILETAESLTEAINEKNTDQFRIISESRAYVSREDSGIVCVYIKAEKWTSTVQ